MLAWAITFFVLALVAGFFGFFDLSGLAAGIAKILLVAFLALFADCLLCGTFCKRLPTV